MKPVIFLDKDGTLLVDVPYNTDPKKITFYPGVLDGLKSLQNAGYLLVVISNQSGIARGYCTEEGVKGVGTYLKTFLAEQDIHLSGFYYCPHYRDCSCRKPQPGMLLQAVKELDISLQDSWMLGDILDDVEAGKRADCKTIFIDVGNETEWKIDDNRIPDFMVTNFKQAVECILISNNELSIINQSAF